VFRDSVFFTRVCLILLLTGLVELTVDERAELRGLLNSSDVPATVATWARIVLWHAEKRPKKEIAALAGVSRPTVDLWLDRYGGEGIGGLLDRRRGAAREQVPGAVRARILAASHTSPPAATGLSHWSSREMVAFIGRTEGVYVSHHYVTKLWRDNGLCPHRQGTFKLSRDPEFAAKIANIVGLYLHPPGGAVVLSLDEKTQIQALGRTQPLLPITFDATEKRTHDYVRHATTNLFAALNIATGEVYGQCTPTRDGPNFLAFLKKAVKPHIDKDIHVVLDNLSIHTTPDVLSRLGDNPNVHSTSPPSAPRGSTRSRPGSASSPASRSAAAPSPPSRSSSNRSATTSQPGTPTPSRSPGPPPPTRSWPKSASSKPPSKTRRQQQQVNTTGSRTTSDLTNLD
jgi:transposase